MDWKQKILAAAGLALLALPAYAQTGNYNPSSNPQGASTTGTGSSQPPGSMATTPSGSTSAPAGAQGENREAMLLGFIHHVNQHEIELSNLAKQNGGSSQVKDFADKIIKDHKSADDQVLALASARKIDLAAMHDQMKGMKDARASGSPSGVSGGTADEHARTADQGMKSGTSPEHMQAMAEHKAEAEKLRTLKGADFDREFVRTMAKDHQTVIDRLTSARSRISDPELTGLVDKLIPTLKDHLSTAQKLQDNLSKAS
jgi:putative membrane protein